MKKHTFLVAFLLSLFFIGNGLSAQEKSFRFETGVNYPIGLKKDGFKENHIGLYFNGLYNLPGSAFGVDLNLSYESYTIFPNGSKYPYNGRSVAVIPSAIYNLKKEGKARPYVGIGTGISIDNIETGVFNEGHVYHFAVVPKIGIRIVNHINITAMYYITKNSSRLMIGCGYTF